MFNHADESESLIGAVAVQFEDDFHSIGANEVDDMLGFFRRKKLTTADVVKIAIRAALLCRGIQERSAGVLVDPAAINILIEKASRDAGQSLSSEESGVATLIVMRLLVEETFIGELYQRAWGVPNFLLTPEDDQRLEKIVPELYR